MDRAVAAGQAASRDLRGAQGLAPIPNELSPGDSVTFTAGKETFYPGRAIGFEVGPVTVMTHLRPGESAGAAYGRAAVVAYQMFETEFQTKRVQYFRRLAEVGKQ